MPTHFDLHQHLLGLQDADAAFEGETLVSELGLDDVSRLMDDIVGCIVESPENIMTDFAFDGVRSLIKNMVNLEANVVARLVDILVTGLKAFLTSAAQDLADASQYQQQQQTDFDAIHKPVIEMYAFLLHWAVDMGEARFRDEKAKDAGSASITKGAGGVSSKTLGGGAAKGKGKGKSSSQDIDRANLLDWDAMRRSLLEVIGTLLKVDIHRVIISASERESFVGMIIKSTALILEDKDAIKNSGIKNAAFVVLGIASKKFDNGPTKSVQMRIVQLVREDHLAEPIADFLAKMSVALDFPELMDGVLRETKDWEFSDEDSKPSKAFAKFLAKVSDISSDRVLKNMVSLQNHMDSDAYVVRVAMLEVIANLIHHQLSTNASEAAFSQMLSFYNILEERFADKSSYVRSKLLQILAKLAEQRDVGVTDIPLERWRSVVSLTIGRLYDKASIVRKNAVKLLTRLVESTPFLAIESDKGKLSLEQFERKRNELKKILKEKFPDNYGEDPEENDVEEEEKDSSAMDAVRVPAPDAAPVNVAELNSLRRFLKYYSDGVRFLRKLKTAMPIICELLSSNTKTEVIECMRFFSVAVRYSLDGSKEGVKAMVHKIWERDTSGSDDEGSIRDNLLKSYKYIYMDPMPDPLRSKEELIATNLIGLIQEMNLAEITSLEQLLGSMMLKNMIPEGVVDVLWSVFGKKHSMNPSLGRPGHLNMTALSPASKRKESSPGRRRGALAILSMLGKAKKEIIASHTDALFACGLGEHAQTDLLLAKYACVTLQQLGTGKKQKGTLSAASIRKPMQDPIFTRLCQLILLPTKSYNWFGFAEQAVNTIYLLSEHPDSLCAHVIQVVAERIFDDNSAIASVTQAFSANLKLDEPDDNDIAPAAEGSSSPAYESMEIPLSTQMGSSGRMCDSFELSKLCFLVGHVGIRQIAHLEAIEQEWKRRKHSIEPKAATKAISDELEQVTATAEDEFTDAVAYIREMELLFGQKSLLSLFGPMISFICSSNLSFNAPILQVMAVLALCKLMCVSSKYCDENLQLLFTILEKSTNPVIRSNIIIGLGDMAVSFNSLIDQNISYLYNRLSDSDLTVKKNTLMVLTHLILNGMVKVKGQLSEMAKCLEDADSRVSDLGKLFFTELATKDNAIYNNLPDIISNLSHKDTGVDEEQFRSIMKFLFEFLKKAGVSRKHGVRWAYMSVSQDKQNEAIIEKLCARFKNAIEPRLWRDVAYCISLVSFSSERSIKKLMEALPVYQDKLHEPLVFKYIHDVVVKAKKLPKIEKGMMDDFEEKLTQCRQKCMENEESIANAGNSKGKKTDTGLDSQTGTKKARVKPIEEEELEEDDESGSDDMSDDEVDE
ncbi:non-SMC mitotic condensation complex subunit 1-domain-containing protein [Chytriomyces sp. MP71]|nr:non-SMC mitotic condensation complex subunit 1-domain-containing protein [Chytriomyces sp. MP71]